MIAYTILYNWTDVTRGPYGIPGIPTIKLFGIVELSGVVGYCVLAIVVAAVFTVLYGRFIDRLGFVKSIILPFTMFIVGLIILTLFTHTALVFIGSLLMIAGFLAVNSVYGVMIRDYTPKQKVGLFQGIRIVVGVLIPMLVGPWIGSLVSSSSAIDAGFGVVGDDYTPSSLIFIAGAVVSLLSIITIYFIARSVKKEKENFVEEKSNEEEK